MLLDGTGLRQSWYNSLDNAQSYFKQLLSAHSSSDWKRVPIPSDSKSKGKARASATPELSDVVLHKKVTKSGENVYRAILDVPTIEGCSVLEAWKAVLSTPELRREWDPAVESAHTVELLDQTTRVSKVNFTLGWPTNPRDAVTISRSYHDVNTLIYVSTSLPRSPNEPAYLRPSPPYVRSEVALFAWCVQIIGDTSSKHGPRLRATCFWQHNLKALWTFSTATSIAQQLGTMMVGLFSTVKHRGQRIPRLSGYGNGVSIERIRFEIDREALTVDYSIVPEDEDHTPRTTEQGLDELYAIREFRRLTRSAEFALPASIGWDVQMTTKASSTSVARLPWTAQATRQPPPQVVNDFEQLSLCFKHASLPDDHSILKVRVVIELSGPSNGIRLNGIPQQIEQVEERDPMSQRIPQQLIQDSSSAADLSFNTQSSSMSTIAESASRSSTLPERPPLARAQTERSVAAEKLILSRVKRNYIYFSSLLQEPEAKWKRNVEARGVSIAQLDSIDPTLVVYRAEATFVGLGLWDLYSAVSTPGARAYWDRLYDDSILLEHVNELTELWHFKTKAAWPVTGRDTVVLKTVYKSPSTIHVFAFSADDPTLFPHIPPPDPSVIRTQIDLQGWAIEALSPTTTQLTLLEQSDPKGWSNKASIPQQMIAMVAGVGEFAIKCGGSPMLTRLDGAKATQMRYDHEKGSFRLEYEVAPGRRSSNLSPQNPEATPTPPNSATLPVVECELRCDLDNWASSLDIVVDPPPQTITCLRRHRLSSGGGGLWLTITHDAVFPDDERLQIIVRRGPMGVPKEKGLVMVNGAKVDVDVEELPEREMKNLQKQKRVKPTRIPLDQPPVLGVIRRRRAEWNGGEPETLPDSAEVSGTSHAVATAVPTFATSFNKFWSYAIEQATTTTQQAVAAISPAMASTTDATLSASKPPMQYALDALSYLQDIHSRPKADGWTLVSEKDFPVYRKQEDSISPVIPVHRGEKVIEGVSAEEVASVLMSYDCRKQWDSRFDSAHVFEEFGAESRTEFVVLKGGFPFRDRGFFLASLMARESVAPSLSKRNADDPEPSPDSRAAIYCVSASFAPESVASFSPTKYNSYNLPVGRIFVDGWILETLDPYGAENYAIPSTRCTRVVAVDYAGSIPAAVNSMINSTLPKSILAVETFVKGTSPPPTTRLPAAGVMLASEKEDSLRRKAWAYKRRDPTRVLIATRFNPGERLCRSTILFNSAASLSLRRSPVVLDNPSKIRNTVGLSDALSSDNGQRHSRSRQASVSSSLPQQQASLSPSSGRSPSPQGTRTRSSTLFTSRGEVRHRTDLLVSELIVDSKLYPDGYDVQVASRIDKLKSQISLTSPVGDAPPEQHALPFSYTAYTLPPSPLHSAGLNTDRPPRHLLRLTLPTAQYQVSTIQDPLTGETRSAPPKPQWLLDMEEGRVTLDIQIRPARAVSKGTVSVDGSVIAVLGEKEALTGLGRDELLDNRASKMDLLSGSGEESEPVPEELQVALAVADDLLEEAALAAQAVPVVDTAEPESASVSPDTSADGGEHAIQTVVSATESVAADSGSSGLLRFLNAYPNPLLRFTAPSRRSSGNSTPAPAPGEASGRVTRGNRQQKDVSLVLESARERVGVLAVNAGARRSYPLSTVVIIALIAFLMGSFLRSLLSPADFIYVVSDHRELEEANSGWREIRRLLEVKYLVGGWDFQIAMVRRG